MPRVSDRIEGALHRAVDRARAEPAPPILSEALNYAVFPGGARIRPTILVSVAQACGDPDPEITDAAAVALELIHCASLVHDDMPCFDDAALRRGKPSVHVTFGEPIALLAGDALIMLAYETLARVGAAHPRRATRLVAALARAAGSPHGICAGQGWESEANIDLVAYHAAKTGALFTAATQMGALAAGEEAEPWAELGERIGSAFQVADDLRDALMTPEAIGKPAGQDARHARPNAVAQLGVEGAIERLTAILSGAISSIPSCPGEAALCAMVRSQAEALTPMTPVLRQRAV